MQILMRYFIFFYNILYLQKEILENTEKYVIIIIGSLGNDKEVLA